MTWKEFIIEFLRLVSFDCIFGFLLFLLWRYIDLKYFSKFEISTLKAENKYLKQENQKVNGSYSSFWSDEVLKNDN